MRYAMRLRCCAPLPLIALCYATYDICCAYAAVDFAFCHVITAAMLIAPLCHMFINEKIAHYHNISSRDADIRQQLNGRCLRHRRLFHDAAIIYAAHAVFRYADIRFFRFRPPISLIFHHALPCHATLKDTSVYADFFRCHSCHGFRH